MFVVIEADGFWYAVPEDVDEPYVGQPGYDTREEAQAEADRKN